MQEEPSVLDYLKAKLSFRRDQDIHFSWADEEDQSSAPVEGAAAPLAEEYRLQPDRPDGAPAHPAHAEAPDRELIQPHPADSSTEKMNARKDDVLSPGPGAAQQPAAAWTPAWRSLAAVGLAVAAQFALERRSLVPGVILYAAAVLLAVWAAIRRDWVLSDLKDEANDAPPVTVPFIFFLTIPLLIITFLSFQIRSLDSNRFTALNTFLWIFTMVFAAWALWVPQPGALPLHRRVAAWFRNPGFTFRITGFALLFLLAVAVILFFRFYQLGQVPGEMISDHGEKLYDVGEVLAGQTSVFFVRNTGREAFQMYLTAAIARFLGLGLTFMSLKLGTVLAGLFALPFIYLLGKEIGNRWVGLLAMFLAGIAYWPNVISRFGLRFPLYPMFAAPALYFLVRGIRRSNRNDFILSGLFLGLGLHGYSPMRIVPFVIAAVFVIYLIHRQSQNKRTQALYMFLLVGFFALLAFLPLFSYMLGHPEYVTYRTMTRMGTLEREFPGPVWQIFLQNLWNGTVMYFWDDGEIWVHSVPHRPALDIVMAAFLLLGMALLVVRYIRRRHWIDLFLLLTPPLLMLPSILSLAFPEENPSLNRSGGAMIPVFIIIALAMESFISLLWQRWRANIGRVVVVGIVIALLSASAVQNYNLVFNQYKTIFMQGAWNYKQIGHVIRSFIDSSGSLNTAFVVPYPYWVDTRLVGIEAGYPSWDPALWTEQIQSTTTDPRAKLFVVYPQDENALTVLRDTYPDGWLQVENSMYTGFYGTKDFWTFYVPATEDTLPPTQPIP